MRPALVVLAAGASERLGRCKALVDLRGRSPLRRLLEAAGTAFDGRPLVVSGAHDRELRQALSADPHVDLIENREWARGRSGSLALAARHLRGRDLCIAPVDVPLVPQLVFLDLTHEWERLGAPGEGWLGPRLALPGHPRHGHFGHPIVLGSALAAHLEGWEADRPLKDLRALARPLGALDVAHEEILDDLDTPADLSELRKRLGATP